MIQIVQPETPAHRQQYWDLYAEFRAWYSEMVRGFGLDLNDLFLQNQPSLENDIPPQFTPPTGRLFLATYDGQTAGCGALRMLTPTIGELNRIYVQPTFRGKGIGRMLLDTLISNARQIGYQSLRLNTAVFMKEAHALYYSVGFQNIEAYREIPAAFKPIELFMELAL